MFEFFSETERNELKGKFSTISPKVKQTNLRILSKRENEKKKMKKELKKRSFSEKNSEGRKLGK